MQKQTKRPLSVKRAGQMQGRGRCTITLRVLLRRAQRKKERKTGSRERRSADSSYLPACSCMSLLRCPITEKSCKASGQTFGHSWMHYGMFASQRRALQQGVTLVGWGHGARGSAASPDQATGSHVLTEAQKRLPSFAYSPSPFFNVHERCTLV